MNAADTVRDSLPAWPLGPGLRAELEHAARELCGGPGTLLDDAGYLAAARAACERLPGEFRVTLRDFRRRSGAAGGLLLGGLPVDEASLPATPVAEGSVRREADVASSVLMLAALALGEPIAFRAEKAGALVQDVVPVPALAGSQSNGGSVELTFHTENAFHPHSPDFVLLLCVRADPVAAAGLRVAGVGTILPELGDRTRDALFRPEFRTETPPSFTAADVTAAPGPVLSGDPADPDICFDANATVPLTPAAADAVRELVEVIDRTASTVLLRPGDLVVVDNARAVHGRTAFRPRYDGRDRWLRRVFVQTDLRRSRPARPGDGHVLDS